MKRFLSLALCIGLLCVMVLPASANTGNEYLLEYDHINTVTANLSISGFWGIASCDGSITARGDYPVYVEVYLQQHTEDGWETLQVWTSEDQMHTDAGGKYAVASGYQYRTYVIGYVYDSDGEVIDSATAKYAVTYD